MYTLSCVSSFPTLGSPLNYCCSFAAFLCDCFGCCGVLSVTKTNTTIALINDNVAKMKRRYRFSGTSRIFHPLHPNTNVNMPTNTLPICTGRAPVGLFLVRLNIPTKNILVAQAPPMINALFALDSNPLAANEKKLVKIRNRP